MEIASCGRWSETSRACQPDFSRSTAQIGRISSSRRASSDLSRGCVSSSPVPMGPSANAVMESVAKPPTTTAKMAQPPSCAAVVRRPQAPPQDQLRGLRLTVWFVPSVPGDPAVDLRRSAGACGQAEAENLSSTVEFPAGRDHPSLSVVASTSGPRSRRGKGDLNWPLPIDS